MGEERKLEEALGGLREAVGGNRKVMEEVEDVQKTALSRVETGLLSGHIQIGPDAMSLTTVIPGLQQKHPTLAYEDHIREHRLKEALRLKQELEQKLSYISETINVMSGAEPLDGGLKKKEERTDTKAMLMEIEGKKKKDSEDFARKVMEQQKELQRRREAQIAKIAEELKVKEIEDEKRREDFERKQAEEREKRIKMMQEKAKARANYLKEMKEVFEKQNPPKIVEKPPIKEENLFPELEKRKMDVLQKRQMTQEEMKEHMRKYKEKLRIEQDRRERERAERHLTESVNSAVYTKSYLSTLEEEKKRRDAQTRVAAEKQLAVEKQRRYAELVKEMYFPAIDKRKVDELQALKSQLTTQKRLPREKSTARNNSVGRQGIGSVEERKLGSAVSDGDVQRPMEGKPPVYKKKKKAATTPPPMKSPEKPKTVDYLGEQRKTQVERMNLALQRFQSSKVNWEEDLHDTTVPDSEKHAKIRQKLSLYEEKARKNEAILSRVDVTSAKGLEAEEGVNDMIISTIKAKLALLQG